MKKFYVLATLSIASLAFSQNAISFEASEGFTLGDINGQNGWTVSERSEGPIKNQIITNEQASVGSFSFKNAYEPAFGDQFMPIMGAEKTFATPLDYKNTTISFDFRANKKNESDFEFAVYAIDEENNAFDTLFALGFENRGYIYLFSEKNFTGFLYTDPKWDANKWYNVKVVISDAEIIYYIDNVEVHRNPNVDKVDIVGMNILHNNYAGDAYYDNFKINDIDLGTYEAASSQSLSIYPNPAKDQVNLTTSTPIESFKIFNMTGQTVKTGTKTNSINIEALAKGNYILSVTTADKKQHTRKFIKN